MLRLTIRNTTIAMVAMLVCYSSPNADAGESFMVTQKTSANAAEDPVTIETRLGNITGLQDNGVVHFRGVRYAEPPTGDRRFLPPVAAVPWTGVYDATSFAPRCVQSPSALGVVGNESGGMNEDCLFLNIVTPSSATNAADERRRPVLFWIHGGAYVEGSANDYDGSVLAAQGDVVVVTINYRLGLLGFVNLSSLGDEFAGSAGNGFRDQILALTWVRDNISDFGGDPDNVTIFGESAGGGSVHALLAAPSADGLYHKAIAHSPPPVNLPVDDHVTALSAHLGLAGKELVSKLRRMSSDEMLRLQAIVYPNGGRIDGTVVTRNTNEAVIDRGTSRVPLIAGTNRDEGTLFTMAIPPEQWDSLAQGTAMQVTSGADSAAYLAALKSAYPEDTEKEHHQRIWTDMFRISAIGSTQRSTAVGPGGWLYRFDLSSTVAMRGHQLGATHSVDIGFTFNLFPGTGFPLDLYDGNDPVVRALAEQWSNTIIEFAKTGDPNGAGLPHWPRYSAEDRQTLILDAESRVESDPDRTQRKLWESVSVAP